MNYLTACIWELVWRASQLIFNHFETNWRLMHLSSVRLCILFLLIMIFLYLFVKYQVFQLFFDCFCFLRLLKKLLTGQIKFRNFVFAFNSGALQSWLELRLLIWDDFIKGFLIFLLLLLNTVVYKLKHRNMLCSLFQLLKWRQVIWFRIWVLIYGLWLLIRRVLFPYGRKFIW